MKGAGPTIMSARDPLYPEATRDLAERRTHLAPAPAKAFRAFSQSVFVDTSSGAIAPTGENTAGSKP